MGDLVRIVDDIAMTVITEHAKNGQFTDHNEAFNCCVELLVGLTDYEFPVFTPNICLAELQRWSIYWSVSVGGSRVTIELLVSGKPAILSKTYLC